MDQAVTSIDYTLPALTCHEVIADRTYSEGIKLTPDSFCIFADGHIEFRQYKQLSGPRGSYWTFRRVLVVRSLDEAITKTNEGQDGYEAE